MYVFGVLFYDFVGLVVVYVFGGWVVLLVVLLFGVCYGCYVKDGWIVVYLLLNILFFVFGVWVFVVGWFGFNVMSV